YQSYKLSISAPSILMKRAHAEELIIDIDGIGLNPAILAGPSVVYKRKICAEIIAVTSINFEHTCTPIPRA
ncbi:hypothetical protein, partial [Staphylococcus aureus]